MSYLIIDKVTKKFDGMVVLNEISLAIERGGLLHCWGLRAAARVRCFAASPG